MDLVPSNGLNNHLVGWGSRWRASAPARRFGLGRARLSRTILRPRSGALRSGAQRCGSDDLAVAAASELSGSARFLTPRRLSAQYSIVDHYRQRDDRSGFDAQVAALVHDANSTRTPRIGADEAGWIAKSISRWTWNVYRRGAGASEPPRDVRAPLPPRMAPMGRRGAARAARTRERLGPLSRYSDAAYAIMRARRKREITSGDLWAALEAERPDLTGKTPTRKTPRTTCMRDLGKDARFIVGGGKVGLRA